MTLLHEGSGTFEFEDRAAGPRGRIRVHYHVPRAVDPDQRPFFAMHGMTREAARFARGFRDAAERCGKVVVVPEYDAEAFPGPFAYNFGGVVSPPPDGAPRDRSAWGFGIVGRLFERLRAEDLFRADRFDLYGNSAGAQFVLRYAALAASERLGTAIASNSGAYMLLDLRRAYPAGMGGIGAVEADIGRYLTRPIHILLGGADTDGDAADLPRWPEALAQGPHRLARGLWYREHCRALAARLGVTLAWRFEIVPGANHISQAIFDRAVGLTARDPPPLD